MPRRSDYFARDVKPRLGRVPHLEQPARIPWRIWAIVLAAAVVVAGVELRMIKHSQNGMSRALPVLAKVPDFSLTSETGLTISRQGLLGKIWIADFIFTRCAGPCPIMTQQMLRLQVATRSLADGNVHLISVTVDPAYDTPKVLLKYGAKYGTNPDRWSFLTGDPATVENFITKGMLLGLAKDGKGMPIHSQKFVVVDREGYIRAYHDLDEGEALIPRIVDDVLALVYEHYTPLPEQKKDK